MLLSRMTNLSAFAEAPLGCSVLESSYDRSGGNVDWVTYRDRAHQKRITVFEAEGPGCISRIWIASFNVKQWRFYFDGEPEPRLVLDKDDLFGGAFPFVSPLAGQSGGGRYCLLPIPFSKQIRIEEVPAEAPSASNRNYFQINYTRLAVPPGRVDSFPAQLSEAQSNAVVAVDAAWDHLDVEQRDRVKQCLKTSRSIALNPGQSVAFWEDEGVGQLKSFCVRVDSPSSDTVMRQEILRGLRLQMFWDGMDLASVDVPLGDFFCNPFYVRSFSALPLACVDGKSYLCRFPMPYQKGARCRLVNRSAIPVSLTISAQGDRLSAGGLTRRFHALWRAQNVSGKFFELLNATGHGRLCRLFSLCDRTGWNMGYFRGR